MRHFNNVVVKLSGDPVYLIAMIFAVALIIMSVLTISPFFTESSASVIGKVFTTQAGRAALGVVYMIPSVLVLRGWTDKRFRRWPVFFMGGCYIFLATLRLAVFGTSPIFWIFMLAIGISSGVVYLHESLKDES